MNRRDVMKLASLAMLPMMPGAAMASSDGKAPPLRYKVFTVTRAGLNRDVLPGKESRMWVANSATLIYGEQDAVLVDTFLTVEQCNGLADAIVASGKALRAIYITHAHGDHFFGSDRMLLFSTDYPLRHDASDGQYQVVHESKSGRRIPVMHPATLRRPADRGSGRWVLTAARLPRST